MPSPAISPSPTTPPRRRPGRGAVQAGPLAPPRLRSVVVLCGGDAPVAQFARFLLAGGLANVLYAVLFLLMSPFGAQPANLAGALTSAALANELHRRLTFRAGDRVGWRTAQWTGGGLALAGWAATSIALSVMAASGATEQPRMQIALVLSVTAAVGLARFAALRLVFQPRAVLAQPADGPPAGAAIPPGARPRRADPMWARGSQRTGSA